MVKDLGESGLWLVSPKESSTGFCVSSGGHFKSAVVTPLLCDYHALPAAGLILAFISSSTTYLICWGGISLTRQVG